MRHLNLCEFIWLSIFFLVSGYVSGLTDTKSVAGKRFLFTEVILLIKIVLTATATFTVSERRSSTLKGIKHQ